MIKMNRTYLIITSSSIALIIVLFIQVNWIFETAKIKEEIFNEKANMVLSRTTDAICKDKETCMRIGECIAQDSSNQMIATLADNDLYKIDSLFKHYMKYYNFHVDYKFQFVKQDAKTQNKKAFMSNAFYSPIDELNFITGLELKLVIPDKKQFIMAEMGSMFLTSVVLIIVVIIMFWRTILSLMKEKKISEHTTDFLNNMTHEFKTPLTNIALAGKMIVKDPSITNENKIKHYSEIILDENEKLRLQVEQVLSMTALERGEIPLQKSELNFHEQLNDIVKCMSVQIENKNGNLEMHLNAINFVVVADKNHLRNAMCNIIDNAIKYSNDNVNIRVETYNENQNLILKVTDTGIGIEKEYHKKVFDKFFRVPTGDIHNVKGFGLGLAYVKKIIELHRGNIEIHSERDKGTIITITLPNA